MPRDSEDGDKDAPRVDDGSTDTPVLNTYSGRPRSLFGPEILYGSCDGQAGDGPPDWVGEHVSVDPEGPF